MSAANAMYDRAGRLASSSFVRAVALLSTGQFIAAALPMLAAPILGRLYLPADYGVLATYMALANVLGTIATLQLQHGIIAESSDRRAMALVAVCRRASMLVAAATILPTAYLYQRLAGQPDYALASAWLLMLPVSVVAAGSIGAIAMLANRHKRYADMARIQVMSVGVTVAASIGFGLLGWGAHGLLASYFLGHGVTLLMQQLLFREMAGRNASPGGAEALALVRKHRAFAIYTLPSELVGTFNLQMPVFALSALGAAPLLGAFSRARQLVGAPLALLGSSIAQVFRQRAAEQVRACGSCRAIYGRTLVVLAVAGVPPTILLMVFAPDIFRIVLGPNWTEAGEVARILAPMLMLRLICSPLSTVFYVVGAQRVELVLSTLAGAAIAAGSLGPVALGFGAHGIIVGFAAAYCVVYALYIAIGWRVCRK